MIVEWLILKSFVDARQLSIQWVNEESKYWLRAMDGNYSLECSLDKNSINTSEILDFETNYKNNGNQSPSSKIVVTSNTLSSGASTSANQVAGNATLASIDAGIPAALGQTTKANSMPVVLPSDQVIIVSPDPGLSYGMSFGQVTSIATTEIPIRSTIYLEPTVGAQRSIVSDNFFDGPFFGTGSVKITYYTSTGAGPFTETIAPAGLTPVNTVATNICFIEKMEMVGNSTLVNGIFGTITLFTGVGGAGTVIGTFGTLTGGKTLWTHHYVPTGKTCKIIDASISSTGNAATEGAQFTIKSKAISGTNIFEPVVSDFLTLEGANTSTVVRKFSSPIVIVGPARVTMYVTPFSANSVVQRASFSYVEI